MRSVSRRRFGQLAVLAPVALLTGHAAPASLIETILSRALPRLAMTARCGCWSTIGNPR